jgi:hypothetical protein
MNRLDRQQATENNGFQLRSHHYDTTHTQPCVRAAILAKIHSKLKEYDELLLREHQVMSIPSPSESAYRSYHQYLWNEKPLVDLERAFIRNKNDLALLGDQDDSWFGPFVSGVRILIPKKLFKVSPY